MHSLIKLLFVAVSLVAVIRLTNAATAIEIVQASPDDPNKCFRSRDNLTLAIGESKIYPDCYKETCVRQGDQMALLLANCGLVAENEECQKVEDKTKPYPACCPTLICA